MNPNGMKPPSKLARYRRASKNYAYAGIRSPGSLYQHAMHSLHAGATPSAPLGAQRSAAISPLPTRNTHFCPGLSTSAQRTPADATHRVSVARPPARPTQRGPRKILHRRKLVAKTPRNPPVPASEAVRHGEPGVATALGARGVDKPNGIRRNRRRR